MNNTNQHLYMIYSNIHSFYEYRNLYPLSPMKEQESFIKMIQKDKYMILPSVPKKYIETSDGQIDKQKLENAENMRLVVILLVYPGTECENKQANMIKIINKITYNFTEVLVITPIKISAGVSKKLKSLSVDTDKSYKLYKSFTYTLFNTVLPNHILVPKYEILNEEQIDELKKWYIDPNTLPKILENDPQMVWLGAKVGDVIKFTLPSEITIESVQYCIVIHNI